MSAEIQSFSSRSRRRKPPLTTINVTPFVDVMLVLLIVFMVTAPLLTVGVPVNLPETQAPAVNESEEPLVITLSADGTIYLQETALEEASQLLPRLQAVTAYNKDAPIFIRGDSDLNYGAVMRVMGDLSQAGFSKVALLAKLP